MLDRDDYREGWKKKEAWYAANGYIEDKTCSPQPRGKAAVAVVADRVRKALDR